MSQVVAARRHGIFDARRAGIIVALHDGCVGR